MAEQVLAPLIAVGIVAALFLWIPTLDLCGDRCQKLLRGLTRRQQERAAQAKAVAERETVA